MRRLDALMKLDGRVAVVTGGAGYIGLAIGEALAECGADVMIVDRDGAACERRSAELRDHGKRRVEYTAVDLALPESAGEVVRRTVDRLGRLDILVNNAAFVGDTKIEGWAVPFSDQTREAWEAAFRVNSTAAFSLVQAAREQLAASGHGVVINIASIYGVAGPDMGLYTGTQMANPAAYGASKGALLQLTRYLATVLAPQIRVNAISPGGIERQQPAVFRERYVERTPLKRMGTEEDLKGAIAFLASDASAYVTGHNLLVDGGWTAW
jgi:NAD(P)-dependent dehydrogenase (short-subunit alcohol dehydrogenase family)